MDILSIGTGVNDINNNNTNVPQGGSVADKLEVGQNVKAQVVQVSDNSLVLRLQDGSTFKAASMVSIDAKPGDIIEFTVNQKNGGQIFVELLKNEASANADITKTSGVNMQKLLDMLRAAGLSVNDTNIYIAQQLAKYDLPLSREIFDKILMQSKDSQLDITPEKVILLQSNEIPVTQETVNILNDWMKQKSFIGKDLSKLIEQFESFPGSDLNGYKTKEDNSTVREMISDMGHLAKHILGKMELSNKEVLEKLFVQLENPEQNITSEKASDLSKNNLFIKNGLEKPLDQYEASEKALDLYKNLSENNLFIKSGLEKLLGQLKTLQGKVQKEYPMSQQVSVSKAIDDVANLVNEILGEVDQSNQEVLINTMISGKIPKEFTLSSMDSVHDDKDIALQLSKSDVGVTKEALEKLLTQLKNPELNTTFERLADPLISGLNIDKTYSTLLARMGKEHLIIKEGLEKLVSQLEKLQRTGENINVMVKENNLISERSSLSDSVIPREGAPQKEGGPLLGKINEMLGEIKNIFAKVDKSHSDIFMKEINYEKIREELADLFHRIREDNILPQQFKENIAPIIKGMEEKMGLVRQFTYPFSYVELPINLNNHLTTAGLYIFKDSRKKNKVNPANMTVFISLSTANLGQIDSLIRVSGRSIECDFTLDQEEQKIFVKEHITPLYGMLEAYGYKLTRVGYHERQDDINPTNAILLKQRKTSNHSFDACI